MTHQGYFGDPWRMNSSARPLIYTVALTAALTSAVFSLAAPPAAPPQTSKATLPQCRRPLDFSVSKDVAAYEACIEKQEKFCDRNDSDARCQKIIAPKNVDHVKTGAGADGSIFCAIQKDGSYLCQQEMVRFLVPEEVIQPSASPTGLPTINDDGTVTNLPVPTPVPKPAENPVGEPAPPPPIPSLFGPPPPHK